MTPQRTKIPEPMVPPMPREVRSNKDMWRSKEEVEEVGGGGEAWSGWGGVCLEGEMEVVGSELWEWG